MIEAVRSQLPGTLCSRMNMELLDLSAEGGVIRMPVAGNTQPAGLLHGGASIALAETVASLAAFVHARTIHGDGATAVGVDVSATHHRSARSGEVIATATARHLGKQLASYLVEVTDKRKHLLCTCTVTTMLLPPRAAETA
nr:hotdog fold thioesterase [Devriesea agamarum]